jgi:threonine/homoserine/homoserine lactone efflux protein
MEGAWIVDIALFWSFLGAAVILTIMPGPDNMFVLAQSIAQGRHAGIATTFGICTGLCVHIAAATLGISAVIYRSAVAFAVVKYAGAAYLLYLAWKSFRAKDTEFAAGQQPIRQLKELYKRGIVMSALNPKLSLFFLALLPQFVNPDVGSVTVQMLVLGLTFIVQAFIIFSAISFFAGKVRDFLIRKRRIGRILNYVQGAIFVAIGLRLAVESR